MTGLNTKQSQPSLAHQRSTPLNPPPSPKTHRALRRLQSASALGASASQPGLISQQHKEAVQRKISQSQHPTHQTRGRSNSDAMTLPSPAAIAATPRLHAARRTSTTDAVSLDRLIRDGPPNGDVKEGLDGARLKVLLEHGIKSDNDGMVSHLGNLCCA